MCDENGDNTVPSVRYSSYAGMDGKVSNEKEDEMTDANIPLGPGRGV